MMIMIMCTIIINDNGTVVELVTLYFPIFDLYLVLHLMVVPVWLLVMMMVMMIIDNMMVVIKNSTCPP